MKKSFKFCSICFAILISCFICFGCSKEENITNINIKGIYLSSSNANNNNIYNIKFLMIEILDFKTNDSYVIYNGNDLSYQIKKPKPFLVEDDYLFPNEKSIFSINGNQFKLIISLTIDYNGEDINLNNSATIEINYTNEQMSLKNSQYNKIIASLLDLSFELNDGEKESISLILNAEQIKN